MANWPSKRLRYRLSTQSSDVRALPKIHFDWSSLLTFCNPALCLNRQSISFHCTQSITPTSRKTSKAQYLLKESKQWDEQAARYEEKRSGDPIYMAGVEAAVRALAPQKGDRILDSACGTGLTITRYHAPSIRIVALDLSKESLKHLRRRTQESRVAFLQGDLTALPFADNEFDKVLCANAIQHFPSPELRLQGIRELARVVRPGGRVVVTVHNFSHAKRQAGWKKEGPSPGSSGNVNYIYRFDVQEFGSLLASALQVDRLWGAGLPLPYQWKLSPLSRCVECILSNFAVSTEWGHMLVGVGHKASKLA